ncbi:site-specific integrase [Megasphaera paucivorans]|uniref:Site-specific recombinase XerD n=1 Tax=Megasphaera paucivorans TaxID=349095 RepID=A0A1G9QT24_9FIRM|nr:site-specific integrase [Megasphaera paucivorans]SDM13990.1 Site-specific recombinase XerD [Megasphaera paucivorans]
MQLEYTFTFREKDNGIQVILSYKDAYGKWHQRSKQGFKGKNRRALAKLAGDKLLEQVKETVNVESENCGMQHLTLRQLKELFLRDQKSNLEYNTRSTYDQAIDAFNTISDREIVKITYADIVDCLNNLSCRASTKQLYMIKIKRLFRYAISPYKILMHNPATDIIVPKDKENKKLHALSQSEFMDLLNSLRNSDYAAYVVVAIAGYAGLRYGEIAGLTWDAVDVKRKTITVCQQYGAIDKNIYGLKPTKNTNGNREIPIPDALVTLLKEYRCTVPLNIDKRIFKGVNPVRINRQIHISRPDISIHNLRHTYATLLLANGVDIRTVAALLGDKTETVLKTYVHYTDEMREKAKEDINKIFCI